MWIKFFISIVVILLAGLVSLRLLFRKSRLPLIFVLPTSFLLGSGIISWQLLIYSIFGFEWSFWTVSLPWFASGTLFVCLLRNRGFLEFAVPKFNFELSVFELLLIAGIAFQLGALLLQFSLQPQALGWDAVSGWFYKAKVFFNEKGVSPVFLSNRNFIVNSDGVSHSYILPDYPPLIPLLVSWVFLSLGSVEIFYGKLLWALFLASLLLVFFLLLKEYTGRKSALFFTFLVISLPIMFDHLGGKYAGYADLPLVAYMLGAVVAWLLWLKKKGFYLPLAVLLASFGALTKYEGAPFVLVIVLLTFYFHRSSFRKHFLIMLSIIFLTLLPWLLFITRLGVKPYFQSAISPSFERLPIIIGIFAKELINLSHFNLLWVVFFITILFTWLSKLEEYIIGLLTLLGAQLASYVVIFLVTPFNVTRQLHSTVDRLVFHVVPIALVFIALTFSKVKLVKK